MKKKLIKTTIVLTILFLSGYYIISLKLKPDRILYMEYNGLSSYYHTYYVTENAISLDTLRGYSFDTIKIKSNFIPKHHLFKNVDNGTNKFIIDIPLKLLFEKEDYIGSPDMFDQGGVIIKFELLGITKSFNIDPFEKDKFYPPLLDSIDAKTRAISAELKNSR